MSDINQEVISITDEDKQKIEKPLKMLPKDSPLLKELYTTEYYLSRILFYDQELAIEMLKCVSTLKCFHARKWYCHHAQPQETKKVYSTKKNCCTRNTGLKSIKGHTYYQNRQGLYKDIEFVMVEDSNLQSIRLYQMKYEHKYWRLTIVGDHDDYEKYPCCEEQILRYNFSKEEEQLIKANLLKHKGIDHINELIKNGENDFTLKCTMQQLRRHAKLIAKQLLPDDILIQQYTEQYKEFIRYEVIKDQKTQQLSGIGVVNLKYSELFKNDGGSVVFCDFTHIRLQNQNMMALILSSQTVGSKFTYILGAYLFRNKDNVAFAGETDFQTLTATNFFKKYINFSQTRLALTDAGQSVAKINKLLNQHTVGGLCAWHWWQNFKQNYGSETNSVRFLFFSLMRSPTQADFIYREQQLKDKLTKIKQFNRDKWNHLVENYDRLLLLHIYMNIYMNLYMNLYINALGEIFLHIIC
ncbi:Hypothetical_protein [Hexamita inflata]|uniref:Hypothetical_protein n=1 Tax=Hexamita inflata TaxID=28002 RepID=A0AA86NNA6_9EUKA|nr:Hypothetical protein HINF_LOCUS9846 [Hexamita inflata]